MKKYFIKRIITSIVIVFIILVAVRTVGAHFFEKGYAQNDELINGVVKLLLFFGTLYILKTEKLINWEFTQKSKILTLAVSLTVIFLSGQHAFSKMKEFSITVSIFDHFAYAFNCVCTGFFEEFFFRILIFVYVCKVLTQNTNNNYIKPVLITSFLFAIVHITNFLIGEMDIISAINQMMFAFLMGILFQSLFYRIKNILLTSVLHAVVNYNGMLSAKLFKLESHDDSSGIWQDFLQTMLVFVIFGLLVVLPITFYSLKKRDYNLIKE